MIYSTQAFNYEIQDHPRGHLILIGALHVDIWDEDFWNATEKYAGVVLEEDVPAIDPLAPKKGEWSHSRFFASADVDPTEYIKHVNRSLLEASDRKAQGI